MSPITYQQALRLGLEESLATDPAVLLLGVGINDHLGVFGTTIGLQEAFGAHRVIETPIVENALTGLALGLAAKGYRPVVTHIRVDFLLLAMDQIVNGIAPYSFGNNGSATASLTIRAVVGRGWGQGYQHSKSLHSMFAHVPGLEVYAPATVSEAYWSITKAIQSPNPSIVIEHRWLYFQEGEIEESPEDAASASTRLRDGHDAVIVATSWMAVEAVLASKHLQRFGISVAVFSHSDLHRKLDDFVLSSVKEAGVVVVADNDWLYSGFASELAAQLYESCFGHLKEVVGKIGFRDTHIPTAEHLERDVYPDANDFVAVLSRLLGVVTPMIDEGELFSHSRRFKGPF